MFYFLCKTLLRSRNEYTLTAQNSSMAVSSFLRYLSSDANHHSFTVSYLVSTCGLSPESALSASKSLKLKTPEKPDLIISFFKKHRFSTTQISEMIGKFPKLLSYNPEKIIFPKVEFFLSKGASIPDLIRIFTFRPWILQRSLENHIVPSFNFYRDLFQSDEEVIAAVQRFPSIMDLGLEANVVPNIKALRKNGVPATNVLLLVREHPRAIVKSSDRFEKIVEEVREMGFNYLKSEFVVAVTVLSRFSKSTRDKKVDAYKRWGWSDKDIVTAFRKYPRCLSISEDKIMAVMDFYVNKLGLHSSVIAYDPFLLSMSLEKRLIPRGAVIQLLASKGLIKLDSSIVRFFRCKEKFFLEKIVNCREEGALLWKLYNEKLVFKKQGD